MIQAACVALALVPLAGPPKVTALYPAGAQRGQTALVQAFGAFDTWPVDVALEGGEGLAVAVLPEKGQLRITAAPDAAPGRRWIRLHNAEGAATPRPFDVGTLPELNESEPNNLPGEATPTQTLPVLVNGRLERSGEVDCFAVELARDQTLVAGLDAFRRLGSPMDGVLQIVSPRGAVAGQADDDSGLDPLLTFTATESGRHVVRVFAFPAQPDSTIGLAGGEAYVYRLTLTTGPYLDYQFPLAIEAGTAAELEGSGWNLDPGRRSLVAAFTPPGPVEISPAGGPDLRPLWITREAARREKEPNDLAAPEPTPFPAALSGKIERPGDVDAFLFEAKPGLRVRASVAARALGRPLDPVLRIFGAERKKLGEADDQGDARDGEVVFEVPADGHFVASVEDFHGRGSDRHAYLLRVGPTEPDLALGLTAAEVIVAAGKPLEIPLTIDRKDGLKEELVVTAEDLPPGLEAPAVRSKPGDATEKAITLKVTSGADTAPWRGPIRVLARCEGSLPLTRTARAALPGQGGSTERLWLTVTGAGK